MIRRGKQTRMVTLERRIIKQLIKALKLSRWTTRPKARLEAKGQVTTVLRTLAQ